MPEVNRKIRNDILFEVALIIPVNWFRILSESCILDKCKSSDKYTGTMFVALNQTNITKLLKCGIFHFIQ
jgi:hypothetical protein